MGGPEFSAPELPHPPGRGSQSDLQGLGRSEEDDSARENSRWRPGDSYPSRWCHADRSAAGVKYRVLIVDDEPGIRQALKQVLEYEKLQVKVTASGGEALTLYADFNPHLVFLDVK